MSLDVYITTNACAHCGREGTELFSWNYTYNVSDMLGAAAIACGVATPKEAAAVGEPTTAVLFGRIRMLDGIEGRAGDYVPKLEAILAELRKCPEKYRPMEPSNGWGSYDGIVSALGELLDALRKHPDAKVETWR